MGRDSRRKRPPFLFEHEEDTAFLMVGVSLLESERFQTLLTPAERMFYLCCAANQGAWSQKDELFKALKIYFEGSDLTDYDIRLEAGLESRAVKYPRKFVFPQRMLKRYGYSAVRGNQLLKALFDKGFIRVVAHGKDRRHAFLKLPTVYEFSDDWRKSS